MPKDGTLIGPGMIVLIVTVFMSASPLLTSWSRTSLSLAVTKDIIWCSFAFAFKYSPAPELTWLRPQGKGPCYTNRNTNCKAYNLYINWPLSGRPSVTMLLGKIFFSKLLLSHCVGRCIRRLSHSCKRVFDKMKWQCHPTLLLGFSQHSRPRLYFLQKV